MSAAKQTYTAKAIRSGNWWAIEVPEVAGVFSQARRLDQVEDMARDAIALLLDVPADSFDVIVDIELPSHLEALLDDVRVIRDAAQFANWLAMFKAHRVAQILHESEHMPLRDIGKVLGVSHQRAHQLLSPVPGEDELDPQKRLAWEKVQAELGV